MVRLFLTNNKVMKSTQGGTMKENYEFTNLVGKDELIKDIRSLEEKIEQTIGDKVNLIAYSSSEDSGPDTVMND
jgi:hypothetical protein